HAFVTRFDERALRPLVYRPDVVLRLVLLGVVVKVVDSERRAERQPFKQRHVEVAAAEQHGVGLRATLAIAAARLVVVGKRGRHARLDVLVGQRFAVVGVSFRHERRVLGSGGEGQLAPDLLKARVASQASGRASHRQFLPRIAHKTEHQHAVFGGLNAEAAIGTGARAGGGALHEHCHARQARTLGIDYFTGNWYCLRRHA
nr:hypothetical protein [Tanacetum cinerariifolium]